MWYEWYPADAVQITNLTVKPGDTVNAGVSVLNTALAANQCSVTVYVGSTRVSFVVNAPSGTTFGGHSGECIVERPKVNGAVAQLPNFDTVTINGGGVSFKPPYVAKTPPPIPNVVNWGNDNPTLVTMVDDQGNTLATASDVDSLHIKVVKN